MTEKPTLIHGWSATWSKAGAGAVKKTARSQIFALNHKEDLILDFMSVEARVGVNRHSGSVIGN